MSEVDDPARRGGHHFSPNNFLAAAHALKSRGWYNT